MIFLIPSILYGATSIDKLEKAIMNGDIKKVEKLLPEIQLSQNEYLRLADFAQQVIYKHKSEVEIFQLDIFCSPKGRFQKSLIGKIVTSTAKLSLAGFYTSIAGLMLLIPCDLDYDTGEKYAKLTIQLLFGSMATFLISGYGGLFLANMDRNEWGATLVKRYDDAIQIKNILMKYYTKSVDELKS